jgi:hypothetical protein
METTQPMYCIAASGSATAGHGVRVGMRLAHVGHAHVDGGTLDCHLQRAEAMRLVLAWASPHPHKPRRPQAMAAYHEPRAATLFATVQQHEHRQRSRAPPRHGGRWGFGDGNKATAASASATPRALLSERNSDASKPRRRHQVGAPGGVEGEVGVGSGEWGECGSWCKQPGRGK